MGPGNLFVATPGDAYYTGFESTAYNTLLTNGSHMGATMDGVEVAYEPNYTDIEVDQLKDAAVIFQNGFKVTVKTNLAEATLQNMVISWGLSTTALDTTGVSTNVLSLPVPGDEPTERKVLLFGSSPAATASSVKRRKYFIRRAVSVDTSSHSLKRGEATMIPVSFRCLPDPTYSTAQYGTITDDK